jgi:mxaJ protein
MRAYSVFGDYHLPDPPVALMDALARGDVDVAIAWGPLAGYFGRDTDSTLVITPVSPQIDLPYQPMAFDISMGVRRADSVFAMHLDSLIDERRPQIDSILAQYGVPRVDR